MAITPLQSRKTREAQTRLSVSELVSGIAGWIADGEYRMLSPATTNTRRIISTKFLWWLKEEKRDCIDTRTVRAFLAYLATSHDEPEGRFANPLNVNRRRKLRPASLKTYFDYLAVLFKFLVEEGVIDDSPMATLKAPLVRQDQIQPFTNEQVRQLVTAAGKTRFARRDTALVFFLLDTGARASEVCDLKFSDLNLIEGVATVMGKGNKTRQIHLSPLTRKAVAAYIRQRGREPGEFVFEAMGGTALTPNGLYQQIKAVGSLAGVTGVRCSPHTFRHTFAVTFLRAGGNVFSLQQMLGHTRLTMTQRYVALASADMATAHRQFSPAQSIMGTKKM